MGAPTEPKGCRKEGPASHENGLWAGLLLKGLDSKAIINGLFYPPSSSFVVIEIRSVTVYIHLFPSSPSTKLQ